MKILYEKFREKLIENLYEKLYIINRVVQASK